MSWLIKGGLVFYNDILSLTDILISEGKIAAIGHNLTADHEIDATGLLVTPGLVDLHVHYRDPGLTYKETITTGSKAAAHGGFTTVGAMPNVKPVPNTAALLSKMVVENQKKGVVHILQYAPLTQDENSDEILDYQALKEAGAFALSNDGFGVQNAETMYKAMQKAAVNNLIVAAHAQDDSLFNKGVINEGDKAEKFNLPAISELAETTQIARDLLLAAKTGVHYHVCHVSTKTSLDLIRIAKKRGINVTCEVAPHHILLSQDDILTDDPYYKMNPPLRSKDDQMALIEGLLDGTVDFIATDHAPHAAYEKEGSMLNTAFGITGSETCFSMLYTKLAKTGIVRLEQLLTWLTVRPADLFNLKHCGRLVVGEPADIAIFDLNQPHQLQISEYQSKGKNTPFTGNIVYGTTAYTIVDGNIVYQRKEVA
jgi:dihydroorotase